MSRKVLALVFSAMLLPAAPVLAAPEPVSDVVVAVDLGAVTNTAAAQRFATLDTDLKNALMTRLVDRIGPEGLKVEIDISELELSNFYQEAVNAADTRLVGQVNVSHLTDNTDFASYELAVGVNDVTPITSASVEQLTPAESTDRYYTALINAFADAVVKRLGE